MKITSELARETADRVGNELAFTYPMPAAFDTKECAVIIQSALDVQAAQYREVINVATDALEKVKKWDEAASEWNVDEVVAGCVSALTRIAELTPKP